MLRHLRTRLLLVVALATLPLLLYTIGGFQADHERAHLAVEQRIRALLGGALVPETLVADNARQVLRIMANADNLRSLDADDCSGLARRLLETQTHFANLGAALPDGRLFCSGQPIRGDVRVSDRRWFQEAMTRTSLSDGELIVGKVSGEQGIAFGYPLLDEAGRPRAVLFGTLRLKWVENLVRETVQETGWFAAAYAVSGDILFQHVSPGASPAVLVSGGPLEALVRTRPGETVRELAGPDGQRHIVGLRPFALTTGGELYLVVGAPERRLYAEIEAAFWRAVAFTLLVAGASFLLAWAIVQRNFLRFAEGMGKALRRIAGGDLTARSGVSSTVVELSDLQQGLDRMAEELERLDAQHRADQSDLLAQADRLRELNGTLDGIINSSDALIYITDLEGRCQLANRAVAKVLGRSVEDLIGRRREDVMPLAAALQQDENDRQVIASGESITVEETLPMPQGEMSFVSVKFPLRDRHGEIHAVGGITTDITLHRAQENRIQQLLNYDGLTGLPNRNLFLDRLQQAVIAATLDKDGLALFSIDLARFRAFNDSYGQAIGDAVLVEVGRRLQSTARRGDSVARLASDEFALLMTGFTQDGDLTQMAQRLTEALTAPMHVGDTDLAVAVNIGIAVLARDATDVDELRKAADAALAKAKAAGRNTFRFFAAGMDVDAERRLMLEAELRKAVAESAFELHYQPQADLATGRICGTEALMRWPHPRLGAISPAEFIPLAEETGLIQTMGDWALREACRQNRAWLDAGFPPMTVAVNLSARQFHQPDLVERVRAALEESGLPPELLELELTESAFIDDAEGAIEIVRRIKALGVLLALDDFGTGYSSLSYLSGFPFDKIKIDQSFVRDITTNPVNAAIATATIAMARSLNLVTLAEGVENEAQMEFLRGRQCEVMQGWLFARALPVAEVTAMLREGRALKVSGGGTARRTLLLVDDEPHVLSSLHRLLRRDGYEVLTAETPHQAFDLLARHPVQVIVSDQRMPEMSGTEFLEKAKRLYPDTVRIILSGYTDVDSITDAINRGAIYHFMTKPWDDDRLRAEIREAFRVAEGFAGR